jgi:hypothetical protein
MDYGMGKYDEQNMAQAEYAKPQGVAGVMAGSAMQNQSLGKQQPIRERVQEAIKRANQLASNLSFLADNVAPQPLLNDVKGLVGGEPVKDSTLTSEVGDLLRELGRIEHQVQRLSLAITG